MNLKYAVIGVGGLGGYYGGRLAKNAKDVHFLFHSDYEIVKEKGLKVDSVKGNFYLPKVNAYKNISDIGKVDVVLICLKTTNNYLLKEMLPPLLHERTLILLMQNGLGNEEKVSSDFPQIPVAGALAYTCSSKIGPGHISHTDLGSVTIAPYVNCQTEVLEQVVQDFVESDVDATISQNLLEIRWRKLIWNIPFNGMSVVLNTTTNNLVNNSSSEKLCYDLMLEVIHAANACGVYPPLSEHLSDEMMELTRNMEPYAPSMKLDYDFNRQMEIEYLYTHPLQEALKHGCHMKKTEMLEEQLKFLSSGIKNKQ